MQLPDERRDYYRINDTVGMQVEPCATQDLPSADEFANQAADEFTLINHLSRLDLDNSSLLNSIQDQSPDIARYLKLLNLKIEAIAKQLVSMGLTDEVAPTEVELSAGGINLLSQVEYNKGDYAKIRMILYPSNAVISCYGKVIRCNSKDQGFDLAFEFHLINETDRDTLVRHVLQLQSNSLRKRSVEQEQNQS